METPVPIAFTDRELDVMSVLWDAGSATVAQVRERLSDDLAYTTVLTVLRTLEQKGYVRHPGGARHALGLGRGPRGLVPRAGGRLAPAGCVRRAAHSVGEARRRRTPGHRRPDRPAAEGRRAGAAVLPRRPRCHTRVGVEAFFGGAAALARRRGAPVGGCATRLAQRHRGRPGRPRVGQRRSRRGGAVAAPRGPS